MHLGIGRAALRLQRHIPDHRPIHVRRTFPSPSILLLAIVGFLTATASFPDTTCCFYFLYADADGAHKEPGAKVGINTTRSALPPPFPPAFPPSLTPSPAMIPMLVLMLMIVLYRLLDGVVHANSATILFLWCAHPPHEQADYAEVACPLAQGGVTEATVAAEGAEGSGGGGGGAGGEGAICIRRKGTLLRYAFQMVSWAFSCRAG